MAGVTYSIRKLAEKGNTLNLAFAFAYSIFLSSGAWLFTIGGVGIILIWGPLMFPDRIIKEFQSVIIYNFSISFVLSGIISFIICRDVSDKIYSEQFDKICGVVIGSMLILYIIATPLIFYFYFFIASFSRQIAMASSLNFLLLLGIWHVATFLTTLKEYRIVSLAFLAGMILSVSASLVFGSMGVGVAGVINSFNAGLVLIYGILLGLVIYEYSPYISKPFSFFTSYKRYWELAIAGVLCNTGIWIDKWIMWFSPDSVRYPSNLVCDMNYSNALFLGYLTIIPALAYFLYSIEYVFDREILKFYNSINNKATLSQIYDMKKTVIENLYKCMTGYFFIQGIFTVLALLSSVEILELLDIPMIQLSIFRYAVLGAFFQFFFIFFVNILFYLDQRKSILLIYGIYLVLNTCFTYISIKLGYQYYGVGFCAASLITFIISGIIVALTAKKLDYLAFIQNK